MLQIKIILGLILLAGAGGGYLYVNKLQKDNAILKTNQIKLETAVAESNQVIEQQSKDLKKIRSTLKEVEELNDRLQADKKIINKASDSAARCVEIASGSPLTEEELNGTPNRECPSFWPSDNTTE